MLNLESSVSSVLSGCSGKIKTIELVSKVYPDVKRNKIKDMAVSLIPVLQKMEADGKIRVSWKNLNSTKEYPRFINILPAAENNPLWVKQIEDIVRDFKLHKKVPMTRKKREDRVKDKINAFCKIFEEHGKEVVPSGDWQSVFMIFIEESIDNNNVWTACVDAFKAGVLWSQYKDKLEGKFGDTSIKE